MVSPLCTVLFANETMAAKNPLPEKFQIAGKYFGLIPM